MYKDTCCKATFFIRVASRLLMTHQVKKIISHISKECSLLLHLFNSLGPTCKYRI